MAAAGFSLLINILYLAPTLYMLQVYDRVVPTGGRATLFFITLALAIALMTLSSLDMIRNRLLIRASLRLDALLAPRILQQMMGADSAAAGQAMRDFDSVRTALATPVVAAVFDAPWTPLYLLVAFMLHFWIGIMAVVSAIILVVLAALNRQATQKKMDLATAAMAAAHNSQQAAAVHGSTIKALGMTTAVVDRQLDHRRLAVTNTVAAQFAGGRLSASSRFFRLFVQSAALGLGALLALQGSISSGAIIASSVLLSRALQPIENIIGAWSALASARAAARRLSHALETIGEPRVYTALPAPRGDLLVQEVGLRNRDGRTLLLGISFHAEPGKMLGHHRSERIGQDDSWQASRRRGAANRRHRPCSTAQDQRLGPGRARPSHRLHAAGILAVRRDDQGEYRPIQPAADGRRSARDRRGGGRGGDRGGRSRDDPAASARPTTRRLA